MALLRRRKRLSELPGILGPVSCMKRIERRRCVPLTLRSKHFSSASMSDEENAALLRRISDAMKRSPHYPKEQENIRDFWRSRIDNMRGKRVGLWSLSDMWMSIKVRALPLKASAIHFAYCSFITGNFMYLHNDGDFESTPDAIVETFLHNVNILSGCTGFLATALFLMLSFRINRGVGRWWEGRSLYGDMLGNLRSLTLSSQIYMRKKSDAVDIGILAYAYARSMEFHLRKDPEEKVTATFTGLLSRTEMNRMMSYPIPPYFIAEQLTRKIGDAFDRGDVKGVRALVALQETVQRIVRNTEGLNRIRATPEPWSYQKHMRATTILWLGILPLCLLPSLTWATPLLASPIGYVVFKLDDISVELQNPFGFDRSDLSICIQNELLQEQFESMLRSFVGDEPILPSERIDQSVVDDEFDRKGLSHDI